jgi:hypothetical protein
MIDVTADLIQTVPGGRSAVASTVADSSTTGAANRKVTAPEAAAPTNSFVSRRPASATLVVPYLLGRAAQRLQVWCLPVIGAWIADSHRRVETRTAVRQSEPHTATVVSMIRRMTDAGALSCEPPKVLQLARGEGLLCTACDTPITPRESEYSFCARGVVTHRFHPSCHQLWEAECRRRGWRAVGGKPSSR